MAYLPTLGELLEHLVGGEEAEDTVGDCLTDTKYHQPHFILELIGLEGTHPWEGEGTAVGVGQGTHPSEGHSRGGRAGDIGNEPSS